MAKPLQAIEVSLRATLASREAVQEILKRGAETGIFFAGARKPDGGDAFDLTEQDRDFLPLAVDPSRAARLGAMRGLLLLAAVAALVIALGLLLRSALERIPWPPRTRRGVARRAGEGPHLRHLRRALAGHPQRGRRAERRPLQPALRGAIQRAGALAVRLALSGACAPDWPLEDELTAAAAAGYEAVELWLPKLWAVLERSGPDAVAAGLKRRHLAPAALAPIADATFRAGAGLEAVTAEEHGAAALARAFGTPWVVVQPGERPDGAGERDALREGRHTLGRLALAAERYDVGLAICPLGYAWSSIRTVREAGDIIEAVGRKSLAWPSIPSTCTWRDRGPRISAICARAGSGSCASPTRPRESRSPA